MHYRHRLRSRIIISFVLLGTGLTALFAVAVMLLRANLETELVGGWLQHEASNFVEFKREHPEPTAQFRFSRQIEARVVRPTTAYRLPLDWQALETGVHDLVETVDGHKQYYKLAVQRTPDMWGYLRYDYTQEVLSQRNLIIALLISVVAFAGLALLIGVWSSRRVMRPVSDLVGRLRAFAGGQAQPELLAPHFANDEVGELAQALDDYAERMTALVRRDREFNADISHELRTPLAVIHGATELVLGQSGLDDKTRARLQRIERASRQSNDLIAALLMLSRQERGSGATALIKVAQQVADANRANLAGKALHIAVEGDADVLVDAPDSVLAVAMGNLVGNACKYTREGEVRIRVLHDRVQVDDTGPGISAEDAEHLFERGYRGSSAGGSKGAGIGLAIVSRLCELYGWRVWIEPRAEGGARATLAFNLRAR